MYLLFIILTSLAFVDLEVSRKFPVCITSLQVSGHSSILNSYIKLLGINNILLSRFKNIYICVLIKHTCVHVFICIYTCACMFSICTYMYIDIWTTHINAYTFLYLHIFSFLGCWLLWQIYLRRQETIHINKYECECRGENSPLCKHENLSFISSSYVNSGGMCMQPQGCGRRDGWDTPSSY